MAQLSPDKLSETLEEVFEDMKAVVCSAYGKIGVEVGDVDTNSLLPNEVVVNVKYCGINFADVYMINGVFDRKPPPFIVGLEVSGKIEVVGSADCGFHVGENVVVYLPDGGAFMEYLVVCTKNVYSLDKVGLSDLQLAASVFVNYLTAYEILNCIDFRKIDKDDSLLFVGCSGGVGLATADLLKNRCNIMGVCSEWKCKSIELQKQFKRLFSYENYELHLAMDSQGPTVIVDTMAGRHIKKCLNLLRTGSVYIVIGAASALDEKENYSEGFNLSADLRVLANKGVSIHFINIKQLVQLKQEYVAERAKELFTEAKNGTIRPFIYKTYKSQQVREAFRVLTDRINIGKVIVKM